MDLDIKKIISRMAERINAKSDSELAKEIGVTRQVFSTWKNRGTIPYEKILEFAYKKDIPLDYLFFGKGAATLNRCSTDPILFDAIGSFLAPSLMDLNKFHGINLNDGSTPYFFAALIYNRLQKLIPTNEGSKDTDIIRNIIKDEVNYLIDLELVKHRSNDLHIMHEEEENYCKEAGIEIDGETFENLPADKIRHTEKKKIIEEAKTSIHKDQSSGDQLIIKQKNSGTNQKIAARDFIEKDTDK